MKVKVIRLAAAALLLGCSWKTSLLAGWWIGVIPETKQTSPNAMEVRIRRDSFKKWE